MTIPKHLKLLVAATVSTFFAVSVQAQIWDAGDESVVRVGEEVLAAGDTINLSGNSGLTWAAGNTVVVEEPSGGIVAAGNAVKVLEGAAGPVIIAGSDVSVAGAVSGRFMPLGRTSSSMSITRSALSSSPAAISASWDRPQAARTLPVKASGSRVVSMATSMFPPDRSASPTT